MIYLIESSGFRKKDNGEREYFQLLKIGYTEDNRKDLRYSSYKLHNPTIEVLSEISNGSEDQEKRLQYKFKDLKFKEYGNEWFYYSEDIINFFKNIKNSSELDKLPRGYSDKTRYLKYKKIAKEVIEYSYPTLDIKNIEILNEKIISYYNKLVDELGDKIKDINNVYDYIKKDFGDNSIDKYLNIEKSRKSEIYSENKSINQEVCNFFRNYRCLSTMYDKLKFLCESKLSGDAIKIILDQLSDSDEIKSYYTTLGPSKLYSLGYNITRIKKELSVLVFNPSLLNSRIYQEFKEGDKILLSEIKDKLTKIYEELGYNKSPKAIDIGSYFEIREFMITTVTNGEKKRSRGYELLKKKEN